MTTDRVIVLDLSCPACGGPARWRYEHTTGAYSVRSTVTGIDCLDPDCNAQEAHR